MLSENAIDNLVSHIATRQESINVYVLSAIASKIREIGTISSTDINRMKLLVSAGADIKRINLELAKLSGVQVKDIKALIKTVAIDTHMDAKPLYDYRHKSFIPYTKNEKLQKLVTAIGDVTANSYENLSNSKATGFLIRDSKNPNSLKFQSIGDTYKTVMDEAIQAVSTGVVDYRTAMRRTIQQLSDSGVRRMYWESGYTQRLDTAVRRNLLEGVRAIQQAMEDEIGKSINADGKELSVHMNSALDHEPFQGHQFSNAEFDKLQNNEDFTDVNGQKFSGVDRVIGQYNCRHIARSIILGVSRPLYTQEELDEFIRDNHAGYTMPNGKQLTLYECSQIQRQMETKIRYAKDAQIAFYKAGDIETAKIKTQLVKRLTDEYKKFSNACGLQIKQDRIAVAEYKPIYK